MPVDLSLIIPTRDRARYLEHSLRTCLANNHASTEILVLDNASVDDTPAVVRATGDARVRHMRSDTRLSMRKNFERGLDAARGEIVCFIGDDDGLFPDTVRYAVDVFKQVPIDALSAARAHYFWPDFLTSRRNTALLPRHQRGLGIRNSREELKKVLLDADYYRLPCVYHGFVRRAVLERVRQRQGGSFFLSNNVDIFSAIALSMENLNFAFSGYTLVINGGSARSNGASHFGGGHAVEKSLWKQEDDVGFLPGFADSVTMASFIVESGLRYIGKAPETRLDDIFGHEALRHALLREARQRIAAGRSEENSQIPLRAAGLVAAHGPARDRFAFSSIARLSRLVRAFRLNRPLLTDAQGISDISGAAIYLSKLRNLDATGWLAEPSAQFKAAIRLARG